MTYEMYKYPNIDTRVRNINRYLIEFKKADDFTLKEAWKIVERDFKEKNILLKSTHTPTLKIDTKTGTEYILATKYEGEDVKLTSAYMHVKKALFTDDLAYIDSNDEYIGEQDVNKIWNINSFYNNRKLNSHHFNMLIYRYFTQHHTCKIDDVARQLFKNFRLAKCDYALLNTVASKDVGYFISKLYIFDNFTISEILKNIKL